MGIKKIMLLVEGSALQIRIVQVFLLENYLTLLSLLVGANLVLGVEYYTEKANMKLILEN